MTEHYFSNIPQSKSSPKTWKYQLRGKEYTFTSDVGVFSKDEVDFGSRFLVEKFEEPTIDGDFLDLGCGYGPLGITLADYYPNRHVVMVDVNERALVLAEDNARQNDIDNVEVKQSDRFSSLLDRKFAAIITNPPIRAGKRIVHAILEESKSCLLEQGEIWVVIQKKQGAPSVREKLNTVFGNVEVVARNKGYYLLKAVNV
ncbi:class I SAM-dependent methyltransferase [Oceanobacillus halotolerans]|uniref:class I SAM-dependent methyltransferase n=1 Tax=Oceanobacillus halotolerans TaxID=2663380 RepID=UPI0013DCB196|nr:class I SAM-dependent methyltransferase [Oceanobacillus halotolerans]